MDNPTTIPVQVGEIVAGKYRVRRLIGIGGMGVVAAAEHLELGEERAIKVMLPAAAASPLAVERFLREARAASRLRSQHVARVHDIGRLESGLPYIVMEMLEGSDLKSVLGFDTRLPLEAAVRYLCQACEAIGEAHALGVVHRDIKPANIFMTRGARGEDCIKVLDFGIAKVEEVTVADQITRTQEAFGTPLYMSPEQMRSSRETDERTDVWSLGVLLYRMLAGREPFVGETITAVCSAVVADTPVPPSRHRPDIPPGLEQIILKCLSKDPAGRFDNAIQLGNMLAEYVAPSSLRPFDGPPSSGGPASFSGRATAPGVGRASSVGTPRPSGRFGTEIMITERPPLVPPPEYANQTPYAVQQTTKTAFMADRAVRPPVQAAPPPRSRGAGLIVALVGASVLIGLGAAVLLVRRGQPAADAAASTSVAAPPAALTTSASIGASPVTAAPPASSAPAPASPSATAEPTATATATAQPVKAPTVKPTASSPSGTKSGAPSGVVDPWATKKAKSPGK